MKTTIYHQCGFRYNWNFEIYKKNNIGDGFILSPKDMEKEFISKMEDEDISKSFFDSQFYGLGLLNTQYLSYGFLDYIDNLSEYAKNRKTIAEY